MRGTMRAAATTAATLVLAATLAACMPGAADPRDARDPDAVGTVEGVDDSGGGVSIEFVPDAGYEYFEGTVFEFGAGGDLESVDGEALDAADVAVGDRIEVWVEACAESFPVQCADPVGRLLP